MRIALPILLLIASGSSAATPEPGPVELSINKDTFQFENRVIGVTWRIGRAGVEWVGVKNNWTGSTVSPSAPAFTCMRRVSSGSDPVEWESATFKQTITHTGDAASPRRGGQVAGKSVEVELRSKDGLRCTWRAELRDGSNYVLQQVELQSTEGVVDLERVVLIDAAITGSKVSGECSGSPIVTDDLFFGFEHPMSQARVEQDRATAWINRALPLRKGQSVTYSSVVGVAPRGQMRRAFLNYVERERAHPYRPFLHYNSWYDLGMFTKFDEAQCLDVIREYGRELVEKRGVKLDSFLFDDGWDNYESMWEFHKGFPNGFMPLKTETGKIGAGPGVWLSPWGGYGDPRNRRLAYGKAQGFEVDNQGYALSGPKYYKRFHDVTLEFVTQFGINHFKFDGTGSPDKMYPGSAFDSDFEAAIQLIADLRAAKPDLFINLTTGTWPSPFWLRHADSTWRGGSDHSFAGVGSDRQRWITYRDADTYSGVVRRAPLYPINSLMLHGIIYAPHANKLNSDPNGDFRSEVRSYFGSGTQLQELYVSPKLLTRENWDDLAASAKWARENADVLVDTHWVGGDPGKLEVYGWASWSPRKGILVLRNPSDRPQAYSVDPQFVFELPEDAIKSFVATNPYARTAGRPGINFAEGRSRVLDLEAYEVRVLEFAPKGK